MHLRREFEKWVFDQELNVVNRLNCCPFVHYFGFVPQPFAGQLARWPAVPCAVLPVPVVNPADSVADSLRTCCHVALLIAGWQDMLPVGRVIGCSAHQQLSRWVELPVLETPAELAAFVERPT